MNRTRTRTAVGVAALALLLAGCTPEPEPTTPAPRTTSAEASIVERVIDGDTIVMADGETVRLIGVDTPERGRCGYREATTRTRELTAQPVELVAVLGRDDHDRYGRLLRYVDTPERDVGAQLIVEGLARPRYNSSDGYGPHPREGVYEALGAASTPLCP